MPNCVPRRGDLGFPPSPEVFLVVGLPKAPHIDITKYAMFIFSVLNTRVSKILYRFSFQFLRQFTLN